MLARWESVGTIFSLTTPPSATPRFLNKALSTPRVVKIIITYYYNLIRRRVINISKKQFQEAVSRDNLTTKRVCMFYRRAREYIIAYKLMSHGQTLSDLDIDFFTHISVEIIYNMVKYSKTHRFALDFDRLFLRLLVKENK